MEKNKILASHTVPTLDIPQRLSDYAIGIFSEIPSRKGIKKAIKKGLIHIDNKTGNSADWIKGGECLSLSADTTTMPPLAIDLQIIYEDHLLAVIYKPSNILVSGNHNRIIVRALPHNLKSSDAIDALPYPLPVHRLDYETAGVLLVAKTRTAYKNLQQQFYDHTIQKKYIAICQGKLRPSGIINAPIDNKEANTEYKCLQTIDSDKYGPLSLVAFYPITGRTHQIRIHAASIDCPILGDKLYGLNRRKYNYDKSHLLLAQEISLTHPDNRRLTLSVGLPRRITRFFPDYRT